MRSSLQHISTITTVQHVHVAVQNKPGLHNNQTPNRRKIFNPLTPVNTCNLASFTWLGMEITSEL